MNKYEYIILPLLNPIHKGSMVRPLYMHCPAHLCNFFPTKRTLQSNNMTREISTKK